MVQVVRRDRFTWAATLAAAVVLTALTAPALASDKAPAGELKPYTEQVPGTTVKFDMLPIPGGKFKMGSPDGEADRNDDEGPQFEVEIEPFWMGKYEVTWDEIDQFASQYQALKENPDRKPVPADREADAVSIPTPLFAQDAIPIINRMGREGGYPVASLSQYLARQYTKWLSKKTGHFYRLPTEAEWEYAARAGTTTAYYFGDDPAKLDEHAWYFDNSEWPNGDKGHPDGDAGYRPVGQKKPNPWGLHDIYGNVAEWVIDQYEAEHYKQFAGKTVSWREAVRMPTTIFPRVVRGGGWDSDAKDCRSAARKGSDTEWQIQDPQKPRSLWWYTESFWAGMRLVRPLKEPTEHEKQLYWEVLDSEQSKLIWEATKGKQIRVLVDGPDAKR